MGIYSRYVLPRLIDKACSQPPMQALRGRYVSRARGDVLEVGIGSGLNLPHYSDAVSSVTGLDPAAELTVMARDRARAMTAPVDVLQVSGEEIPADDGRYDSLVCTWTLCSIPNVYRAVSEMHRVLKPGGSLYFVEHGKAPDDDVHRWQRRIEPIWKIIGGGCHLTRKADDLLAEAGFELGELDSGYEPGPRWATFMTHGVAIKPT